MASPAITLGAKVPERLWLQMASESAGSFVDRLYHVIPDMLQSLGFHVNLSTADFQTLGIRRLTGYHLPLRAPSGLALAVSFALTHVDPSCNPRHNAHSAASVFFKAWNTATTRGTVPWLPRSDS
jgi:hypothetical protein